jgi:hypothetical protein
VANNPTTWVDPSGQSINVLWIVALGPWDAAITACVLTSWCAPLFRYSELAIATGNALAALGVETGQVRLEIAGNLLALGGTVSLVFTLFACLIIVASGPPNSNYCFDTDNPLGG